MTPRASRCPPESGVDLLRKLLRATITAVLVPVLLFEEWGWDPLARAITRCARLPLWSRVERGLRKLPPWGAVPAFFAPMLLLLPVKVIGIFLLAEGHAKSALLLLLAAKVAGTAIVAWLFEVLEPALMRIPVFARWYPRWKVWKDHVLAKVRSSAMWIFVRRVNEGLRQWWRRVRDGFSSG